MQTGRKLSRTRAGVVRLIAFLMSGNRTAREIARHMQCSRGTVYNWLRDFRAARCIHISAYVYTRGNGYVTPVYTWGRDVDATKPTAMTTAERVRRCRDKSTIDRAWRMPQEVRV